MAIEPVDQGRRFVVSPSGGLGPKDRLKAALRTTSLGFSLGLILMMPRHFRILIGIAALAAGLLLTGQANAARLRYHYVLASADNGATTQSGAGERLTLRLGWEAVDCPAPRATCFGTFRHPCTGRCIALPLGLPEGTPQMEYRTNRVIYNYSGYTVEVRFQSDGSADVIYNSGLLGRAP